jgi:hypothetical protein
MVSSQLGTSQYAIVGTQFRHLAVVLPVLTGWLSETGTGRARPVPQQASQQPCRKLYEQLSS